MTVDLLVDLLAPQFLAGFPWPDEIDDLLSQLHVNELHSAWDEAGVVFNGVAQFVGEGDASPVPRYHTPTGALFEWEDVKLRFRLTLPRRRSDFIRDAVTAAAAGAGSTIAEVADTLDALEVAAAGPPSDYPGLAFRLELLLSAITLHLPPQKYLPARVGADGWLERDPAHEDVRIVLPKIAMVISQRDTIGDVNVEFEAWGIHSLDDPTDLEAGELISMVPSLCLHKSGVVGFGFEKAVLDLSDDFTPPEILAQFGTGDDFEGLWLPHVRFFLAPSGTTGFAFDVRANDLLIDFDHGVSGEIALDVMRRNDRLSVTPRLFEGDHMVAVTRGDTEETGNITTVTGGRASIAADGELQLAITGGQPPYTTTVRLEGATISPTPYEGDSNRLRWLLGGGATRRAELQFTVVDSSSPSFEWRETIELELREAGSITGRSTSISAPTISDISGDDGYTLALATSQPDTNSVVLQANPPDVTSAVNVGSGESLSVSSGGQIVIPVVPGGPAVTVEATWTIAPVAQEETILFPFREPRTDSRIAGEKARIIAESGPTLTEFLRRAGGRVINLEGHASYQGDESDIGLNQDLSERRAETLRQVLAQLATNNSLTFNLGTQSGHGTSWANGTYTRAQVCGTYARPSGPGATPGPATPDYNRDCYQNAIASFSTPAGTATRRVSVQRGATISVTRTPTERGPAPEPPDRPPIIRRIGIRTRLERGDFVLGEISGELDFQTQAEEAAATMRDADSRVPASGGSGLTLASQPGATDSGANPGDGIVDFRLTVTYDSATERLMQELELGAGASDRDGLLHLDSGSPAQIGNVLGALLSFAPLLADSIDAAVTAEGDEAVLPMVVATAELVTAVTLGLTGAFAMKKIILFGGQLSAVQTIDDDVSFDEVAILLDYAIDFEIDIDVGIRIRSTPGQLLRIRYRALGLKAEFDNSTEISPVFDTSKGYEFDLADPGLFNVPAPLGDILKVLGARVARTNPLTLELDLGLKMNLGIITVDRVRVNVPIDPPDAPSIIPTGLSVSVPGTLSGSGFLDLRDGIKGQLDITIVPTKLRMMAGVGIQSLEDPPRRLTAVIVTLGIEFPTAIPLANSGLGLYGVLGLFAMHYKRDENPAAEVPALDWLNTKATGDPTDLTAWVADADHWAFGVGAVLGTLEGGFILNLKGMLMLELPGPRILIFVKAQILNTPPATEGTVESLGILAVVDLNFVLNKLTIGLIIAYEVESLISLKVPVEAGFSFENIHDWNLYIGSIESPASADILAVVKGQGYLMFDGVAIDNFPGPDGPIQLLGLAVALGIRASVILGDEDIGLYLEVSASLDVGLSLTPFHLYGILELRGTLHIFIVSVSAWARLTAEAPEPTYLHGEACGKVDFFFFSISGCVEISIGEPSPVALPPKLTRGMVLQSRSPALIQGQGTDRPIDASLGEATEVDVVSSTLDDTLLTVPIDSVPILKFEAAPQQDSAFVPFTADPGQAPRLFPEGWVRQGNNREIRYTLTGLEINPPLAGPREDIPAAWRAPRDEAQGADTSVDLALLSWTPDSSQRAVPLSTELTERVRQRWGLACVPPAAAASVLWTFNAEQLGPSSGGWHLSGLAWPDDPDTRRSRPPDRHLFVHEPLLDEKLPLELIKALRSATENANVEPAKVIGDDPRDLFLPPDLLEDDLILPGRVLQLPFEHESPGSAVDLPAEYLDFFDLEPQRIIIESGPSEIVRLLVALREQSAGETVIRAFDETGNLLDEQPLPSLVVSAVSNLGDVPSAWADPAGPWQSDVDKVITYVNLRHPGMFMWLLEWVPPPDTVRLELVVLGKTRDRLPPSVLLCAIEMLREDERIRVEHDDAAHHGITGTIESAFRADELRPLLEPGTRYTISLTYTGEAREFEEGSYHTIDDSFTQRFTFMTDEEAPERLDPWILATTPHNDDGYHFVDDPLHIYFNDDSAIQLFAAYGKALKAKLRKANGDHPADEPVISMDVLEEVPESIRPPFDETLDIIVDEELDCIAAVERRGHRRFSVPIPLERGTTYTLDIETDDPPPASTEPRGRLFRIAFTTSRFLGAEELAGVVRAGASRHRLLRNPLPLLPETPSDAQIENAFMAAGLEAVAPSRQPEMNYLWDTGDNLVALLIDSPEPLWRNRPEPFKETVASDSGDIEQWVNQSTPYLEIVETSSGGVNRFVRSPGGTRTLVMLNAGAADLRLALRQRDHTLSSATPASHDYPLLTTPLPVEPLWRLNDV